MLKKIAIQQFSPIFPSPRERLLLRRPQHDAECVPAAHSHSVWATSHTSTSSTSGCPTIFLMSRRVPP